MEVPTDLDSSADNTACMGGFQDLAYQWLLPRGGIASEEAYPYRGVTRFCSKDVKPAITWQKGAHTQALVAWIVRHPDSSADACQQM